MTGKLTRQCIVASTIFLDHASDFSYVYHQTSMTSEETLKSKLAFEKFALSHGVHTKHYHADYGRFKDNLFTKSIEDKGQTISFCGVGAHHQNGIGAPLLLSRITLWYRSCWGSNLMISSMLSMVLFLLDEYACRLTSCKVLKLSDQFPLLYLFLVSLLCS
jgi:hypothetical protein